MAFRLKTVEYAWETNTTVVTSANYSVPARILQIPETGSRTFLSVVGEFVVRDAVTTAIGNSNGYQVSCSIDGNQFNNSITGLITPTGDHQLSIYRNVFTNHFNTYFTGSDHSIFTSWRSGSGTNPYSRHSYKLYITYQYDDSNLQTSIKTVRLPIDTIFNTLTNTSGYVFGSTLPNVNNIPALDSYLPESSKEYKNIWLEYWSNEYSGATTDFNMFTRIDSGSEVARATIEQALITDCAYFDIQEISGTIDTSVGHSLSARSSLDNRFSYTSPTLYVTYTYRHDQSNDVLNSLLFPFSTDSYAQCPFIANNFIGGSVDFLVPENNISNLSHSALVFAQMGITSSASRTFYVNDQLVGQTTGARRLAVHSGTSAFNIRFDDLAVTSSGYVLKRGFNSIPFKLGGDFDGGFVPLSGYAILNYSSSKLEHPQETVYFASEINGTNSSTVNLYAVTSSIHPTLTSSYYNNGCIVSVHGIGGNPNGLGGQYTTNVIYFYSGSDGKMKITEDVVNLENTGFESGIRMGFNRCRVSEYPNHPTNNLNILKNNYNNKISTFPVGTVLNLPLRGSTLNYYLTYSKTKFAVTGTLQNCSYINTDYELCIYSSGSVAFNGHPIVKTFSTGSGSTKYFYFDWYENVDKIYATSLYPEQKLSNFVTASNGNILTIDFSNATSSGSSSEHSYIFIG